MSRICEICGKGVMVGHNVSYSKRRTRRIFLSNLRKVKKVWLCMKCLKRAKKEGRVATKVSREEAIKKSAEKG